MTATLLDLAAQHKTDKLEHGYCPYYERHLDRDTIGSLLELGIYEGASLRMWRDWLPDARIIGVDIDPACTVEGIECHTGNARRSSTYKWLTAPVDVIIDDASHRAIDIVGAFDLLWPYVAYRGWFVIEDLACVRDPAYGGDGAGGPVLKMLSGLLLDATAGRITELHVYEEIAFIRK